MESLDDERPGAPWMHGVASRRELLAAGVGPRAIQRRVERGRYIRLYDGVYAIGHAELTVAGRRRAIVLACGPRAVLSHRSAAGAWGLRSDGASRWDVTVRGGTARRPSPSVRVFRHPTLREQEVGAVDGVPVTTPARTLLDLAAIVPRHQLRRALEQAERTELLDMAAIESVVVAHPRRPGSPVLLDLLQDFAAHGIALTRSDVEAAVLELCVAHDLPRPVVNRYDNDREVDFSWPDHQLLVEVDGWQYHRTRDAFTRDRQRDRAALKEGLRVARFTAVEMQRESASVAAELAALLARTLGIE